MHKEELTKKTRDQSLFEFLEALQQEYIQGELRLKIYPKSKDKKYWKKVLAYKETKIKDIAKRNSLPNIFDDESIKSGYRDKLIRQTGMPSFVYKDQSDMDEFLSKDFLYYYSRGSEVRVLIGNGEVEVGTLENSPELGQSSMMVRVRGSQEATAHAIEYITRIL